MPGNLMYKGRDPNNKKRGPGYYYHRGNGYWSKYTAEIDGNEWHPKNKTKDKTLVMRAPHKADYNTGSKKMKVPAPKLKGVRVNKGYF